MVQPDRDRRLDAAIAAYYREVEAGRTPERDAYLAEHADLRTELESFLADKAAFERQAALDPGATLPPQTPGAIAPGSPLGIVRYFGDYELIEEIARGGMGVVYRARQVSLNRTGALKMILTGRLASPADVQRFRTEAEAAANLDHPNILPIYEVGEHLGQQYFSMKLIAGGSLADRMKEFTARPRDAVGVVVAVARAVHHAHQRGILHRDLKPANILLDADGTPFVTDFGLAKRVEGDSGLTQSGAIIGTPSYMAPEQARAEKQLTTAADVYALGAILYECLTRRPPFVGTTPLDTVLQVLDKELARPMNADRDLATVAMKCLEKEPGKRYESAAALADDLDHWSRGEPIAARPTTAGERAWRWCKRNPALSGMAAALLLALVTGTLVSAWFARTASLRATDATISAADARQSEADAIAARNRAALLTIQATAEADKAKAARSDAERSLYFNRVALAQQYWRADNVVQADRILSECREDLRGWEWRYLHRVCHAAVLAFPDCGFAATAAFSEDGRRMAAFDANRGVQVWNLTIEGPSAEPVRLSAGIQQCTAGALSHDGSTLAVADKMGNVALWDIAPGTKRHGLGRLPLVVTSLAFSPDGTRLAAAGGDRRTANMLIPLFEPSRREALRVWDVTTGQQLFSPPGCGQSARCSPDGRRLLGLKKHTALRLAPNTPDYDLALWDTATWAELPAPPAGASVHCDFSPDSRRLAISDFELSGRARLRVVEVETGKEVFSAPTPNGVGDVAFSPDGKFLAAVSGLFPSLSLWDLASGRIVRTIRDGGLWVGSVSFSPHGFVVTGNANGAIRFWDARVDPEVRVLASRAVGRVSPGSISPDGSVVAIGQGSSVTLFLGPVRSILLLDAATGKPLHTLAGPVGGPTRLAFSGDSRRLISAGRDRAVRVWDIATGKEICAFRGHDNEATSIALSGAGQLAASTSYPPGTVEAMQKGTYRPVPGAAKIWDATTGRERLTVRHPEPISALALSADGRLLVTTGGSVAKLWETGSGQEIRAVAGPGTWSDLGLKFGADGKTLLMAAGNDVSIWEVETGRERRLIRGPRSQGFDGGALSAHGTRLATARGRDVKLWDLITGAELLSLPLPEPDSPAARFGWVVDVAFTSDGQRLTAVLTDGSVIAWDAPPLK
jgi:WD40 repeat protein